MSLLLFSCQVVSYSASWTEHTRLPCPSPSHGVCPSSCPLNRWYHPTPSSTFTRFSFCPQSFPASGSFPVSWFFASGNQSIRASASASVPPVHIQDWFSLRLPGLISLQSKELQKSLQHQSLKASILQCSTFFMIQLSLPYMEMVKMSLHVYFYL